MQYGIPSYAVVRVGSRQKGAVAVDLAPLEQEQRLWAVLVREGDDFAVVFELLPTKLRKTITDRTAWPEPQRIVGRYPTGRFRLWSEPDPFHYCPLDVTPSAV